MTEILFARLDEVTPTLLNPNIIALAGLDATTGILAQTGSAAFAKRTLAGTAAEITVTNGDGAAGAPTFSLPAAMTFTGKTITGGTFASPTLTTPALGTPSALVLTNATGLPLGSTGVTGILTGTNGGTGVNNAARTITTGGNVTFAGAFATTLTATATTNSTLPAGTHTLAGLDVAQLWSATQSYANGNLILNGATSGFSALLAPATGGGNVTFFPGADTVVGLAATQTLTNKTLTASTNVLGGVTMTLGSDATGDLYYRTGGVLTRLGIGSATNVLTVSGGVPTWAAAPGGGNVSNSGTPTNTQFAQWINSTQIKGVDIGSIPGIASNTAAGAGIIGEVIESEILIGSAVAVTSGVSTNITSISLTAGDWQVWGNVYTNLGGTLAALEVSIGTVSATLPTRPGKGLNSLINFAGASITGNQGLAIAGGVIRLSGTTTVFLVGNATGTVSIGLYGYIGARRMR